MYHVVDLKQIRTACLFNLADVGKKKVKKYSPPEIKIITNSIYLPLYTWTIGMDMQ